MVSLGVQRDRSLVVLPSVGREKERKEITIHVNTDEKDRLIVRRIVGCYLNGYSGIRVVSSKIFSVSQRKAIRSIVGTLYMRIMESDASNMYIQTLIDESKASLDPAIHRMHSISLSMCRDAVNSLENRDVMLAKSVFSMDDDVDHFSFFLMRLLRDATQDSSLANQLGMDPLDCMDHQTLVYRVEHTADNSANIAKHIIMLSGDKQRIPDDLLDLLSVAGKEAVDLYDKAVGAFFAKDVGKSDYILEQQANIEKLDREIASKAFVSKQMNPVMICSICSLRDSIKRIAECAWDIAEIAINRAYKATS